MTIGCIDAIRNTVKSKYEIIVIDNGSDKSFPWDRCAIFPGIDKYIRNETNLGYPVAINQGIRISRGDVIVLLNNDVIVTSDAIDIMCDQFSIKHYSIVGPMTNYSAGIQQTCIDSYEDTFGLDYSAKKHFLEYRGQVINVNWLIGFCMAFPKSLWEEIGPFDESLWPSSGEEIMFCLEARKRGHNIAVLKEIYVHHYGSTTFTNMADDGLINYADICKRNDDHIKSKYGEFWSRQLINA